MRRACLVLVLVAACGGGAAKPATLNNEAKVESASPAMGTVKIIEKRQDGGTIQLIGERNTSMERANTEMAKHCGSENYRIIQEGEENVDTNPCAIRPETAWRVRYLCNNDN